MRKSAIGTVFSALTCVTVWAADLGPENFSDYPALGAYRNKPVMLEKKPVRGQNDPNFAYYASLAGELRNGPNFAGHFAIAIDFCGTGCQSAAIVDANTGKVFAPEEIAYVTSMSNPDVCVEPLHFKPDSRLLIHVRADPNNSLKTVIVSHYLWEEKRFRRIRLQRRPLSDFCKS